MVQLGVFFDRMIVSWKARDQPTQLAHFQLSFVNFECARGRIWCVLFLCKSGGRDICCPEERSSPTAIAARISVKRDFNAPILTLHVVNLLSSFTICMTVLFHSPSCCCLTADFISFRLMLLIFLLLPLSIILPACFK